MSGTATGTTGVGSYGTSGTGTTGTSSGAYGTSGTSGTTGTTGSATGTMDRTGTTASSGSSSGSLQAQDAEFLRKAMSSGMEEVQNAQLAMQNAQRSETRSAASMMLEDHQRSNQQLNSPSHSAKACLRRASSASAQSDQSRSRMGSGGADFDSRYVTEEIRHHREAISDFRKEASSGSDPGAAPVCHRTRCLSSSTIWKCSKARIARTRASNGQAAECRE